MILICFLDKIFINRINKYKLFRKAAYQKIQISQSLLQEDTKSERILLEVPIHKFRKKLNNPHLIRTVRDQGQGYRVV